MKHVAIDFDGVVHRYSEGFQGESDIYDPPHPGAWEAIQELIDRGYTPYILTARKDLQAVREWLQAYGFPRMQVTNYKKPAVAYIDDNAIPFKRGDNQSWDRVLEVL